MSLAVSGFSGAGEALKDVEELYESFPILAVVHQNLFEFRVMEMVWRYRKTSGQEDLVRPIDELLGRVHQIEAPPPESFTPRDPSKPLPGLAFVPDTWEP